ncbi:MAG: DNA repair protein RecN [Chloroflexi bacterium]|nr:DNA repair protein RecN [Chloroflexota bacterium]
MRENALRMLLELDITNIAIIDRLHISLAEGLIVLTGETGAGKSIIIDALGMLSGHRTSSDVIRSGASTGRVEGLFTLTGQLQVQEYLQELGLLDDREVVIFNREINRNNRNTVRINGHVSSLSILQKVGNLLVDIYGQTDHLTLLHSDNQLRFLDRYAHTVEEQKNLGHIVRELRKVRTKLAQVKSREHETIRRIELLKYQIEEIERASLNIDEEQTLEDQIKILGNAERIKEYCAQILNLLTENNHSLTLEGLAAEAVRTAKDLMRVDKNQDDLANRLNSIVTEVRDIAGEIRHHIEQVSSDPQLLQQAIERQQLIQDLKRKYGNTIKDIIEFYHHALEELETLENYESEINHTVTQELSLLDQTVSLATTLSTKRVEASHRLSIRVEQELSQLMPKSQFKVSLGHRIDQEGIPIHQIHRDHQTNPSDKIAFDTTGIDTVEFLVAPNPGEELKPVSKTASGGETSRIMLAIKSALAEADDTATLVFDEIDTGIGGRSGTLVGQMLWSLARYHQVICITHLPQVAAYGDQHLQISKVADNNRTTTTVNILEGEQRVQEIAQMLGGSHLSSTHQAARELLSHAHQWKEQRQ